MRARAFFCICFKDFASLSVFWLSNPSFVFSDIGSKSSYLLAHAWDRRKIRFRYDTTSWFTDSPIASAMSCPQMPTAELLPHNAPRRYTTRFGSGGGGTRRRAYIFVYVSCMYECVWTWALMQQREQREFTMYLSPPVHPIFSVRWFASCRRLNRGFLANVTYIKIFAFARRACKWAISAIYYNWYRVARDAWIAIEIFLSKFYFNVYP